MMTIILALITLLTDCHAADDVRLFAGVCSDKNWPHRYLIEERSGKITVRVEQQITNDKEWFSWGDSVKTTDVTQKSIRFNCPWGVIGKALQVSFIFKFDTIADDGFDATLTEENLKEDKTHKIRFTRISEDQLSPSFKADRTKIEAQQDAP
jgi:hypothetical protein